MRQGCTILRTLAARFTKTTPRLWAITTRLQRAILVFLTNKTTDLRWLVERIEAAALRTIAVLLTKRPDIRRRLVFWRCLSRGFVGMPFAWAFALRKPFKDGSLVVLWLFRRLLCALLRPLFGVFMKRLPRIRAFIASAFLFGKRLCRIAWRFLMGGEASPLQTAHRCGTIAIHTTRRRAWLTRAKPPSQREKKKKEKQEKRLFFRGECVGRRVGSQEPQGSEEACEGAFLVCVVLLRCHLLEKAGHR